MPSNRITGSDGQCTVANHNILFNTWSATFSQVVSDVTAFGNAFAQKRGGLMSGTFSASGLMQDNDGTTEPMPTSTDILAFNTVGEDVTLQTGSTTKTLSQWSGKAVIGNVSPTSTQGGDASISVDGEFTGDITLAWDET